MEIEINKEDYNNLMLAFMHAAAWLRAQSWEDKIKNKFTTFKIL